MVPRPRNVGVEWNNCMLKKHLEYKNVHYPGVYQLVIKSVEESVADFTS